MARILLLETATEVCSVGLSVDGQLLALREAPPEVNHAAAITILIRECCETAGIALRDLDAVAISAGPGSYTGLRVGASTAKGICYALDKPLIAVDTLQSLAAGMLEALPPAERGATLLLPMLDARRKEVWTAVYDNRLHLLLAARPLVLQHDLFEDLLAELPEEVRGYRIVLGGNGSDKAENEPGLPETVAGDCRTSSAASMCRIAEESFQLSGFQSVSYFEPMYMKPPNITAPRQT